MTAQAAQVLRDAAGVLEECGHGKGSFFCNDGTVCMWGALKSVDGYGDVYFEIRDFFTGKFPLRPGVLQPSFPGAFWNDKDETTGKDVQKFLLASADEIEFL